MKQFKNSHIAAVTSLLLLIAFGFHLAQLTPWKNGVLVASSMFAGTFIAIKAFKALRMKAFSIELLVTIAVVGALIIGEYVESAVVTFLFIFGAYLESRTLEKTRASLRSLIDQTPTEATVVRPEGHVRLPVEEVAKGDRVLVRPGEKVAVDGVIVSGQALIIEAAITGESVPASKKVGDRVFSGTLIDSGFVEVTADRVGDDTTFAKIIELMENAQETKTKTQKFLDRFAQIYTPSIVILSILVYAVSHNIELALTFLVIACPGALVISAPVSMVAGIGNGARNGVLVKGGEIMEKLSRIDLVIFDKTGTLTKGKPEVTEIRSWGPTENTLLQRVAEAEQLSEHHLGQTIVAEAKKRQLSVGEAPQDVRIIKGGGLVATVAGQRLAIGNRKLMTDYGVSVDDEADTYATAREKAGNTAVLVAMDQKLVGVISIADQIKPEAKGAIQQLRRAGVKQAIMLTGDNRHTAQQVGDTLGLDAVHAELLPQDKLRWVNQLKQQGYRVAMVGDGINDAPALAAADVGLSMGVGGTDISMETADIVLMSDRLDQFAHAYSLAKATVRNMQQNTVLAVSTVVLLLAGVLSGQIFLASGMLVHELSVLLVTFNAVRLIRYRPGKKVGPHAADVSLAPQFTGDSA